MNQKNILRACLVAMSVAWFGLATPGIAQSVSDQNTEVGDILTRGPVHEAFAGAATFDPQPGILIPRAPPDVIEELPPDVRPEGDNVAWIPGYWAWDDDISDFLWVSGTWRNLPPGRQWISGYWGQSREGQQWTSGYWADATITEVEYLPEPPKSVEQGPNIESPSNDHIWLPGCWIWEQNRFAWQPGFWATAQPNWVWTPAHYIWAPRGFVFVNGYWDHTVSNRGVLFAPVRFNQNVVAQQDFRYTPASVINLGRLINHLFLRPSYGHYYYGDYYARSYSTAGYYPSYSYGSNRYGYDPIFAQQRWENRRERNWERQVQADFQRRRDVKSARPPRTFSAQQEIIKQGLDEQNSESVFTQPLEQVARLESGKVRFQQVNKEDRQRFSQTDKLLRTQRAARLKLEAKNPKSATLNSGLNEDPFCGELPSSPLVSKGVNELSKDLALPKAVELPKTELKIIPAPRRPMAPTDASKADILPAAAEENPKADPKSTLQPSKTPADKTPSPVAPVTITRKTPKGNGKPNGKVDPKSSPKAEGKPDLNPGARQDAKPEGKPDVKPEGKPDAKPEPKPEPEVGP